MNSNHISTTNHNKTLSQEEDSSNSDKILPPPKSLKERIAWLGPGVTWMAAGAGGAGELLFPPRIGSFMAMPLFGRSYQLLS